MHKDFSRAVCGEVLKRGVRLLGHTVTALEPGRTEQSAEGLCFHLAGNNRETNTLLHAVRLSH